MELRQIQQPYQGDWLNPELLFFSFVPSNWCTFSNRPLSQEHLRRSATAAPATPTEPGTEALALRWHLDADVGAWVQGQSRLAGKSHGNAAGAAVGAACRAAADSGPPGDAAPQWRE
eukprot:scaffold991_cov227-Pinguiococcus_pyrenoidosus.AAC.4